jgi:hypothetical protein
MTYMSLHVLAYPKHVTPEELARSDCAGRVLADLSINAREFGPYRLSLWASQQSLPVYHVDSCWARVKVSRQELTTILQNLGAACHLPLQEEGDEVLIIEAEEF